MSAKINIRIIKFWTAYPKRPDGTIQPVDMVEYCAPGMAQRATVVARVSELSRVRADVSSEDIAGRMARDRWEAIKAAYERWKSGQEMPTTGTPLAAWPGITPEQAEVLRNFGLKSVEDIAQSPDSVIDRVPLPGSRMIKENAVRFLAARDQSAMAAEMAKRDAEVDDLRSQLEEMRQIVLAQSAKGADDLEPDGSERPKRRGRPPKAETEAAA